MRRSAAVLAVVALVNAPAAAGWTWPVDGPVLRPFVFGSDPYAAGQHRGIDIGAPPGTPVRAAAAGTVSFVGTVPSSGRTVTVRTADGYSVTLLQLGSTLVAQGTEVSEGETVGTIGLSSDPVTPEPHVHLGVRVTTDPQGYLDPLLFLPSRAAVAPPAEPPPAVVAPSEPMEPDPLEEAAPPEPAAVEASPTLPEPVPAAGAPAPRGSAEPAASGVQTPTGAATASAPPSQGAGSAEPASEPAPPNENRVAEPAEERLVGAETPEPLPGQPLFAVGVDTSSVERPPDEVADAPASSFLRLARTRSLIGPAPGEAPAAEQALGEPLPRAGEARPPLAGARAHAQHRGPQPTNRRPHDPSAEDYDSRHRPVLGFALLALFGVAGAATLAVGRRSRRDHLKTGAPRHGLVAEANACPVGRLRAPRLVHPCARASDSWVLVDPRRPARYMPLRPRQVRPARRMRAGMRG